MERTITVRGAGQLRLTPDRVELPLSLSAREKEYAKVTARAETALAQLRASLAAVGFAEEELRTTDFSLSPVFEGERDEQGNFRQVFAGYECRHSLKLAFPLDTERLADVLAALGDCPAKPEFSVQFTVADTEGAKRALLAAAAADAREKAEVLCTAAGVKLGALVHIDYGMERPSFYSPTRFALAEAAPAAGARLKLNVHPEDVTADESASFVWELR